MELVRIQNGKQLSAFRKACGYTQPEMATLLGVPLRRYEQWEYGTKDKTGLNLFMIPITDFAHLAEVMKGIQTSENSLKR